MDTLEDKQRQFEERLEAIAQRRIGATPRTVGDAGFEARLQDYEARLEAQIEAHRRQSHLAISAIWSAEPTPSRETPAVLPPPLPGQPRIVLHGEPALQGLDRLFAMEFDLARYFPDRSLGRYPTVYAETLEEFYAPYLELMDVSESSKRVLMERLKAQTEEAAADGRGGVYGIYWPGRGCYLNGWLFARTAPASGKGRQPINPRQALTDPQTLPRILATAVHEKQGHGFVSEFTALGEEKKRLGLWRYDIARRFALRDVDTPETALLREKESVVYRSSQLLEEGWSTWIEHHMMGHWAAFNGRPWTPCRYALIQVWKPLAQLAKESGDAAVTEAVRDIQQALEIVLLAEDATLDDVHAAVLILHQHGPMADDAFALALGQPFAYVVGYLLLRKMEARLGSLCLPYAVTIAGNVTYGLEQVAASDLQRLVARDPRLNMDSRLAQLGMLELKQKGNVAELTHHAHEELNLAVPSSL